MCAVGKKESHNIASLVYLIRTPDGPYIFGPTVTPLSILEIKGLAQREGTQNTRERGEGGRTQFVHGRSRMTIDPRIPTMPGRSMSGFHQLGRHYLHQARCDVRCSASRMKGELHPSKNRA